VCLSIIGCDRLDFGYFGAKLVQESTAITSGVPWTILRASQFFEFGDQILTLTKGPVVVVPRFLTQPVAAAEVADELVRLAVAGPSSMVPEIAGPDVMDLADLVRIVQRDHSGTRRILEVRLPGPTGAAMAAGRCSRPGTDRAGTWTSTPGSRQVPGEPPESALSRFLEGNAALDHYFGAVSHRLPSVVNRWLGGDRWGAASGAGRSGVASLVWVREVADPKCRSTGVSRPRWIQESPRGALPGPRRCCLRQR